MTSSTARPRPSDRIIGVLDAGSFKTVCLIATVDAEGQPARIAGIGVTRSAGIKSGLIVDLAAAETAIGGAIAHAERMVGARLRHIDIAVNCGRLSSLCFAANAPVPGGVIERETVRRVSTAGRAHAQRNGRLLLQLETLGYRLDGATPTRDPVGMAAGRLTAQFHAITADPPAIGNLTRTVERCHLSPRRLVAGPAASALAVTSEEERRSGVVVIDIGAGVTGIAAFQDGQLIHTDTVAIGGEHVTLDIVHALRTPLEQAERIKTLYGTVVIAQSDQHDVFSYAVGGDGDGFEQRTTKADLARIIQARMADLLQLVRGRLANAGLLDASVARIVICGGGSGISGLQSFAEGILKCPVREGRPRKLPGLPPLYESAAFAGVIGVLSAGAESTANDLLGPDGDNASFGYFRQVGQWLKEGF
jgi:cell division protein FtsA